MILNGCSNAGFSLTDVRKSQILELYEWVENHLDTEVTYVKMQEDIKNTCEHLDNSKVRMLVPFLRKMNYITNQGFEERNSIIKMNNFFTYEGKIFIEYLKLEKLMEQIDERDCICEKIKELNALFNMISMINLISNGESIYLDIILFLKKYKTMDKNEFFIMTTLKQEYTGDEYIKELDKYINEYRKNEIGELKIKNNKNSFGYIKAFMLETKLLKQENNVLSLNKKYEDLLNIL